MPEMAHDWLDKSILFYTTVYIVLYKTDPDSRRNAYMKVISCKFCERNTVKMMVGHTNVDTLY